MFYERWKRKQNELRLHWGTAIITSQKQKIRHEFNGNEYYDFHGNNVGVKDVSRLSILIKIANAFSTIFFISVCMTSFYYSKKYTTFNDE